MTLGQCDIPGHHLKPFQLAIGPVKNRSSGQPSPKGGPGSYKTQFLSSGLYGLGVCSLTDTPFPRYEHFSVARFYVINTTVIVGTQKMIYRNACYPRKVWVQRTVFSQKEKNAAMIMIWAMPQIFLGAIRPLWLVKLFADNIPNIVLN